MANDKVISTEALIAKFQQALNERWGYIYGIKHEMWSTAKQAAYVRAHDGDPDRQLSCDIGGKWAGHWVTDCSGLFSWAFEQLGGYMYHGSNTMYNKYCTDKGKLKAGRRTDGKELLPGTAVFVWNGKTYSHVGLYIGNNTVIEAMGTKNGVTTTKVTNSKWTHWGELKGVAYYSQAPSGNQEDTGFPEKPGWRSTIRRGSKGSEVKECQTMLMKLGYDIGSWGIDGDFGSATEKAVRSFQSDHRLIVDGVCGPNTWDELDKAVEQLKRKPAESTKTYSVTITGLDLTQAKAFLNKYPGATMSEGSEGK